MKSGKKLGTSSIRHCATVDADISILIKAKQEYEKVIARLNVEEAFKGTTDTEVIFEMEDCPFDFKEGERYLVYSNRKPNGKLDQNNRSFTLLHSEAKQDVEYIRRVKSGKTGGTIQGIVMREPSSFESWTLFRKRENKPDEPMPGIKIFIENSQQNFETVTNEKGLFELDDVPPGNYRIRSTIPSNLGIRGAGWWEIAVKSQGCFYVNLNVVPKGRMSGIIVNPDGSPSSGIRVYFLSAEGITDAMIESLEGKGLEIWDIPSLDTDRDGRYNIQMLPKGNYVVAINLIKDKRKTGSKQYPRTFYPGVANFSEAKIISLEEGESKEIPDFKLSSEGQQ